MGGRRLRPGAGCSPASAGSLGDLLGRRKVFVGGIALFAVASLLCGLSHTPTMLNLARVVQGVGGAMMFATSLALIAQEFEPRERGTAFGLWGATTSFAVAVGPLVGGVLTEGIGWEWIFFVNVPIGIATVAMTSCACPTRARSVGARRLGRARHLQRRALLPRVCPHPRQRRGLG